MMFRFRKNKSDKTKGSTGDIRAPVRQPSTKSTKEDTNLLSSDRAQFSSQEGINKDENGRPASSSPNEYNSTARPRSSSPLSLKQKSMDNVSASTTNVSSSSNVKEKTGYFNSLSKSNTPEHRGAVGRLSSSSTPTHDPLRSSKRNMTGFSSPGSSQTTPIRSSTFKQQIDDDDSLIMRSFLHDVSLRLEFGIKEKEFEGVDLKLPPLQTSKVKHRDVVVVKSQSLGGFGFNLRKAFQPSTDNYANMLLVHLVEPRPTYVGPLMSGDRILEVNGENVESALHDRVVELIKLSGDTVSLKVASVPELIELNDRGAFDYTQSSGSPSTKATRKGVKAGAGTLRKVAADKRPSSINFEARTDAQVSSGRTLIKDNYVWLVHKKGFSLATLCNKNENSRKGSDLASHINFVRSHGLKVKLVDSDGVLEVDETDIEKVNPSEYDKVEDIVELIHLNMSSALHVLRQRYGSSLIHTFAGRHLIIINPRRHLSLYSDRIVEMFRGCRREDVPPHIYATGQQAYHNMMQTNSDQSLILMGVSGSGKTFNARYLLQYLANIGCIDGGTVTTGKLDAVQLLLHAFTSSGTFLNPQATRCSCLYSLEFDSGGSLTAASVRTFLLEKTRVALRPEGELNFNIFYQLLAGIATNDSLRKELLLDVDPGTSEPNHYIEPYQDELQIKSASIVWDLIQGCLDLLEITSEEASGLWSILAAIYHLGYAGVKPGSGRVTERFVNPAAAIRAATLLGIPHEELAKDIFNPPRNTSRMSSLLGSGPSSVSPSISETSSINLSISSFNMSPGSLRANRSYSLDAFVMGLFEHALNSLILLINRALEPSATSKGKHLIHVIDTPGFQNREMAGCKDGGSFDDLCMNYTRERLQMLFHDFTFTSEQERYIQENIDWVFGEIVLSPLSIIDIIDKHVPQKRIQILELTEKRGLLWILEEESTYSGANEITFLEKLKQIHGEPDDFGEVLLDVNFDKGQFTLLHCQRGLPITYDVTGWRTRVREHPSTRVVTQVLSESKNRGIASLYQGRGVAAGMKTDSQMGGVSRLSRHPSFTNPTASIKKSSLCLKTKFQLDYLVDTLRKTTQWYILCILCQPPGYLPGAIYPSSVDPDAYKEEGNSLQGHIDVPLVREQLRQADLIPAARIFKQGFPVHQPFPAFKRRYSALLSHEERECMPKEDKDAVQFILSGLELDRTSYRIGLSQIFFRSGVLSKLDSQVEEKTHNVLVKFQAHLRGYLGRLQREKLELQHAAAHVIQRNIIQHEIINDWAWWKLLQKVKPLLAVWKVEEVVKKKESEIDTLKGKVSTLEEERNVLKESEQKLAEKVTQLTHQLIEAQETAQHASELLEQEEIDRRVLQEQNQDVTSSEHELSKRNEELQLQVAELSILARIKQSEGGDTNDSEAMLEKYWETKRELETLRQRISTEHEDEIERLQHAKKVLEKKFADSDAEIDDLRRNLAQTRKKATKFSSELNDMKLLLESQQSRNEELEKRQRKFDSDLNIARDGSDQERLAKEKLEREKNLLNIELASLEQKYKKLKEDYQHLESEKTEIETELLKKGSSDADTEVASLRRVKRELENKIEELEDEVDDLNIKVDSLQQTKSRLELSQQSLRNQHQKELEGREEDLEQLKATMNKKIKSLEEQLEEEHEHKQQAIKAKRDLEREYTELQTKMTGDPETEKKLRKQVKKYKALLQDCQEELEHEREQRSNAAAMRGLRSQLEDLELRESAAVKAQKRLQSELDELLTQFEELTRNKLEMETQQNELQREKAELESRLEEEQDEIEQMMIKQRQSITQLGTLQQQLNESNFQIDELQETKQNLENKVTQLQRKINELDSDTNRQEIEASEVKVREMEQKLELEKSTNKRLEGMVTRLRNQLERAQSDKAEDSNAKSNDAIKRLQKQMRELREELQEAEHKEQEHNKKRRAFETQISELEASLKSSQSDLKSAHKRIEGLQQALDEGQAEDSSGEEDMEASISPTRPTKNKKKLIKDDTHSSDAEDSYKMGSSSEDELSRITARRKQRELQRAKAADKDNDEDDSDVDEFLTKLKNKRKMAELSDEENRSQQRIKSSAISDEADKHNENTTTSKDRRKSQEHNSPATRHKTDWRALLSSGDEGDDPSPRKPKPRLSSDEDAPRPSLRKKYNISSSDDNDATVSTGKPKAGRRTKYASSDDDIPTSKPNWRKKYNISDDSDDKKTTARRKTKDISSGNDSDIGDTTARKSTTTSKKAWELSSDDDIATPTTSKTTPKKYSRTKLGSSDDDDDSNATAQRKDSVPDSPSRKAVKWNIDTNPSSKVDDKSSESAALVAAAVEKSNNKSFQSSQKRRARRRSRLSNTGTSPEDSPKRTSVS